MHRYLVPGLLSGCLFLGGAGQTLGHHSFAVHFVADETIKVEGTVERFRFSNPHGMAWFTVVNEQGEEVEWRAETNSPNVLRRRGWDQNALKPGDKVVIEGWPARDDPHYMRIRNVTFEDGSVLATQQGSRPAQD